MNRLSSVLYVVFTVALIHGVSANVVIYTATFQPCVPDSTCPQGNPAKFNATFALNGTLSPNIMLNVGDQLQFNLATNVPIHPLTICKNSPVPKFCQGVKGADELNVPITKAGEKTFYIFNTVGIYYYGCHFHPGMGATINVTKPMTV